VRTLARVRSEYLLLTIDDQIASCFARLADEQLRAGHKPRRHDTWIVATALRHDAAVVTQDRDFSTFASVDAIHVSTAAWVLRSRGHLLLPAVERGPWPIRWAHHVVAR
jgi:predicted nucleic acid-binding protein